MIHCTGWTFRFRTLKVQQRSFMSIAQLSQVVEPPSAPVEAGSAEKWSRIEKSVATALPADFRDFGLLYGTGRFVDPARIAIYVYNPFSAGYLKEVQRDCDLMRHLEAINPMYLIHPERPGL